MFISTQQTDCTGQAEQRLVLACVVSKEKKKMHVFKAALFEGWRNID